MGPVRGCCGVPFRRRMFCGGCSWVKRQTVCMPGVGLMAGWVDAPFSVRGWGLFTLSGSERTRVVLCAREFVLGAGVSRLFGSFWGVDGRCVV